MKFTDQLVLDGVRRTSSGYMAAEVKAARTGIQLYRGAELGLPDRDVIRVYRPESEVFHKDSISSYAHRPVTIGHPPVAVNPSNWKDYARGHTADEVIRDGDTVRIPMLLMDAAAIRSVEGGMREISMGYEADIEFKDGKTPDGEEYDAIQKNMRMNHLAIVSSARGGSHLRIGDEEEEPDMLRKLLVDGITIETTEQGAQVIEKMQKDSASLGEQIAALSTELKTLKTSISTKDGEIVVLKKQVEDSKVTPAKLEEMVTARTQVVADAKVIAGDTLDVSGKTDPEIRRAAVTVALGDEQVKVMDDAAISGAFIALKNSAKPAAPSNSGTTVLRDALSNLKPNVATAQKLADEAWDKRVADISNAWKTPVAA